MKVYIELLNNFQKWNPEIVSQINLCSHHFNSDNINPYHAEGSVWTHTMLMYKEFMNMDFLSGQYNIFSKLQTPLAERILYLLGIAILTHDIGKIYTRHVPNGQFGKNAFYGHSFASVQLSLDFMLWLNKETDANIIEKEMYSVILAVSNHMDALNVEDVQHFLLLANNDYVCLYLLTMLNFLDRRNSIDRDLNFLKVEQKPYLKYLEETTVKLYSFTEEEPDIILFCGVPGSGKNMVAKKESVFITSFDDARVQLYKKDFPNDNSSEAEIYARAWEHTKKADLITPIAEALDKHKKIIICNTNLTRRLRGSIINAFHEHVFKIVYVVADSTTIFARNKNRTSKNIDRLVVNRFMYNQQVFSLFEFRDYPQIKISGIELIINM